MDFVLRVLPDTRYEPPISFPFSKWASAARSVPLKNCTYANKRAFFWLIEYILCVVFFVCLLCRISGSASCRLCPSMSSVSSVFRPYGLQTPETGLLTPYTLHLAPFKEGSGWGSASYSSYSSNLPNLSYFSVKITYSPPHKFAHIKKTYYLCINLSCRRGWFTGYSRDIAAWYTHYYLEI